jgi:signal recognition particle subunit SRP54
VVGKPIKFVGVGEGWTTWMRPTRSGWPGRILQKGDVVGLVERAQRAVDEEASEKLQKKMLGKGKFTLEDFLVAMQQVQKMGPLEQLVKLIPGWGRSSHRRRWIRSG